MILATAINCNYCPPDLANIRLECSSLGFVGLDDSTSDSLMPVVRGSVWAALDGSPALPDTEIESALAAALDPKLWAEVRHV